MSDAPAQAPNQAPAAPQQAQQQEAPQAQQEQHQEASPQLKAATEAQATDAARAEVKKYKLKRKDKEIEVDEPYLLHMAQKGYGAESMIEEAKRIQKEVAEQQKRLEALKNPQTRRQAFKELLGDDWRALAEEETWEAMQQEKQMQQMTEGEKALLRAHQEQQRLIDEYRQKEEAQKQARVENEKRMIAEAVTQQATQAIQETVNALGFSPELTPLLAQFAYNHLRAAVETGTPIDPAKLSAVVATDLRAMQRDIATRLDGPALISWLGEEAMTRIRRADLEAYDAKLRSHGQAPMPQQQNGQNGKQEEAGDVWAPWKRIASL